MSKYSKQDLRRMALIAIAAKNANDFRYEELVITITSHTGLHPSIVDQKIKELAETGETA